MKKINPLYLIGIAVVVLILSFIGGCSYGKNKATDTYEGKIEHLTEQVSERDSLLVAYRLRIDNCVMESIQQRDSLYDEIEKIIKKNSGRVIYKNPTIPVTNNTELLNRLKEWLEEPK